MPRISVIIPCYNYARFLPEAVESVVRQTYPGVETIIVNDGSPDNTVEIAEELIAKFPGHRIRLINQENLGISAARNTGIEVSACDYYLPLDADDILLPGCLERLLDVTEEDPAADFAYPWSERFGNDPGLDVRGEFTRKVLLVNQGPSCVALIKKSAWRRAGGYKTVMTMGYEDWEFYHSLFEAGCKGVVVPEVLFLYRRHGPSRADSANRHILEVTRRIKLLHPRMYEPFLCGLSVHLARAVIWLKSWTRDPVMHYIYVKFPGLHSKLRHIKYSLFVR